MANLLAITLIAPSSAMRLAACKFGLASPKVVTSLVLLLLIPLALVARAAAQPAIVEDEIRIDQVNFEMEATGPIPHSEYGHVEFLYIPDPEHPYFLNLVAQTQFGGPGWIVQNQMLLPAYAFKETTVQSSTTVDLTAVGVTRGQSAADASIRYDIHITPQPLDAAPPFVGLHETTIGERVYNPGGDEGPGVSRRGLAPPVKQDPDLGRIETKDTELVIAVRPGMDNLEQATNQCGPGAIANSMRWLESQYPGISLCGETAEQTLSRLDTATSRVVNDGIGQKAAIEGKLRYAQSQEHRLPIDIHYQADSGLTDLGASVSVNGVTAKRNKSGGKPEWEYLLAEMKKGQDVELSIDWLNARGEKTGGHVVVVSGALQWGAREGILTNDDATQGAEGGLRTNHFHWVTEVDGYMQLNGFGTRNRVKAIYSESPKKEVTDGSVTTPCACQAGIIKKTGRNRTTLELICLGGCDDARQTCEKRSSTNYHGGKREWCSCSESEGGGCRLVLYTPGSGEGGGGPQILCAGGCPDGSPCTKVTYKEGRGRELIRCACVKPAPQPADEKAPAIPPKSEAAPTPPATGEAAAEPEKKRGRRLRSVLGGVAKELISPPPAPGPVLTRSPQLSRCAEMLGANTGREHRAEGARRRSSGLSFVREDLLLYINSQEPQITEEMKQCARLLLAFLDGNSTAGDRSWIVGIYETAYERGYAGG